MAKTARKKAKAPGALPPVLGAFLSSLKHEPRAGRLLLLAVALGIALYASGLGYPLVFGDFAALTPARLQLYAGSSPQVGSHWLADASFGWSAKLFGTAWPWHRGVNLALHASSILIAYALFRRLCAGVYAQAQPRIASGWIAFLAAALFALHPAAVYGVAYLSERAALLLGTFGLIALWSTVRAVQDGWRGAWAAGPLACAAGLACGPGAVGVPLAMALIALVLRARDSAASRIAWGSVAIAAALAVAYAGAFAQAAPGSEAISHGAGYLDSLSASSTRLVRYLGFWLLPVTARMAVDIPEAAISAQAAWPGWMANVLVLALVATAGVALRGSALVRIAALGLSCAIALYAAELLWPRVSVPFALSRSYAWMACSCLPLACLIARLPVRIAVAAACVLLSVWAGLAAATLQTFSSHVALWDAAVRRAERVGPVAEDARVYLNRATLHRRDGHLIAAIADYDQALSLQPDQRRALRGRAQAYIDDKQYGAALRDLDRLLELDPADAITHADRGLALMQAGRLAQAGNAFDRAIERGVKEPRVFLNRGLARLQMSGLDAAPVALADIEKALELDPNYALAYFNRGQVFEEAAKAGMRLRGAATPELMRAVAAQNIARACQLGYVPACTRARGKPAQEPPPGAQEGPLRVTPESLRSQGLPPVR